LLARIPLKCFPNGLISVLRRSDHEHVYMGSKIFARLSKEKIETYYLQKFSKCFACLQKLPKLIAEVEILTKFEYVVVQVTHLHKINLNFL